VSDLEEHLKGDNFKDAGEKVSGLKAHSK